MSIGSRYSSSSRVCPNSTYTVASIRGNADERTGRDPSFSVRFADAVTSSSTMRGNQFPVNITSGNGNYGNDVDSFERRIRAINLDDPTTSRLQEYEQSPVVEQSRPLGTADQGRCFSIIAKWNIRKFTGGNNLLDFLEEVEELRLASGISEEQLFRCASSLLMDAALVWFRGVRTSLASWDQFVLLLKTTYLPTDYEDHLMEDIRSRTQHFNEKFAIYIPLMETYFNRLRHKPSESERLCIIRGNMLPEIQKKLALRPVPTISELVEKCKGIEDVFWRTEHWKPPPSNPRVVAEPNLWYRRPKIHEVEISSSDNTTSIVVTPTTSSPPITSQVPNTNVTSRVITSTCWNCRQPGHLKRDCKSPLDRHCYRCGKHNNSVVS